MARLRPMTYYARCLYDGTVLASFPIRKPIARILKRDRRKIDVDGVCQEYFGAGKEISDITNNDRPRFMNIIANSLNTRRAIRQLVLPRLTAIEQDLGAIKTQLDRIERLLSDRPSK